MGKIIHDKWLIEEKFNSLRNDVSLIPPIAPTTADKIAVEVIIKKFSDEIRFIIKSGGNFWIVINKVKIGHLNPFEIWINQKWNGEAPIFNIIASSAIVDNSLKFNPKTTKLINIIKEPLAWIRKYFSVVSEIGKKLEFLINLIKHNIFNSKPSQTPNHIVLVITTNTPKIRPIILIELMIDILLKNGFLIYIEILKRGSIGEVWIH